MLFYTPQLQSVLGMPPDWGHSQSSEELTWQNKIMMPRVVLTSPDMRVCVIFQARIQVAIHCPCLAKDGNLVFPRQGPIFVVGLHIFEHIIGH